MSAFAVCQKCRGFVPPASAGCVHCGAPMVELEPRGGVMLKGLFGLASAGVAAITLMACYGMPPCDTPAPDGGSDRYHCYDMDPEPCDTLARDGGGNPYDCQESDAGTQVDGGMDAGQ
ncbi:hypothetical protein [Archangium lansingense]|uniref:Lipoprotein n=1 Tax=Archangium lansingense TaxID=2995310 RepID=A0ABT4A354_9BACT|nr:hypothetical protein [Archangium lansinium]MCY1076080.1 hypothetical protein [Archangium lansinium]